MGTLSKSPHHTWREPAFSPTCRACLPGPGIFQCSETGLAFKVESAATIVYRYASWSTHLKEADQNVWVPAGPLFNIWALPGTVRAVYLPHFICLSGTEPWDLLQAQPPAAQAPGFSQAAFPQPPVGIPSGPAHTSGHRTEAHQNIFMGHPSDSANFFFPSEVACALLYSSTLLCHPPSFSHVLLNLHSAPFPTTCSALTPLHSPPLFSQWLW